MATSLRDEMKWVVYNTRTNVIWKRFFLEEDAQKKRRKIIRTMNVWNKDEFIVEHIGDLSLAEWKMWKQLQKKADDNY